MLFAVRYWIVLLHFQVISESSDYQRWKCSSPEQNCKPINALTNNPYEITWLKRETCYPIKEFYYFHIPNVDPHCEYSDRNVNNQCSEDTTYLIDRCTRLTSNESTCTTYYVDGEKVCDKRICCQVYFNISKEIPDKFISFKINEFVTEHTIRINKKKPENFSAEFVFNENSNFYLIDSETVFHVAKATEEEILPRGHYVKNLRSSSVQMVRAEEINAKDEQDLKKLGWFYQRNSGEMRSISREKLKQYFTITPVICGSNNLDWKFSGKYYGKNETLDRTIPGVLLSEKYIESISEFDLNLDKGLLIIKIKNPRPLMITVHDLKKYSTKIPIQFKTSYEYIGDFLCLYHITVIKGPLGRYRVSVSDHTLGVHRVHTGRIQGNYNFIFILEAFNTSIDYVIKDKCLLWICLEHEGENIKICSYHEIKNSMTNITYTEPLNDNRNSTREDIRTSPNTSRNVVCKNSCASTFFLCFPILIILFYEQMAG